MKHSFLKIIGIFAVGMILLPALPQFNLNAQSKEQTESVGTAALEKGQGARALEGTWNVVVTIRVCQTGTPIATFKAMDLFIQGGSVLDTNATPPTTRGPGFGSWEHVSENQFSATLRFYMYNADGSLAGVRRVAQDITLGADSNSWESVVGNITYDANGTQTGVGCATAVAQRAE
jgi:hypothetical protein